MPTVDSKVRAISYTVTADDVTATTIAFVCPYGVDAFEVAVKDAAGAAVAWDGAATLAGNTITVDNTGGTDWAATNVITVKSWKRV